MTGFLKPIAGHLVAATFLITSSVSFASGTHEERRDCHQDAMRFCGHAIPDIPSVIACMNKHIRQLSPACQKHFTPPP
jgi:hypothetical protein